MSNRTSYSFLSDLSYMSERWNPDTDSNIFLNAIKIIETIVIIFGNGTLVIFMIINWKEIIKTNLFVFSLTISDLCSGIWSCPLALYFAYNDASQDLCNNFVTYGGLFVRVSSITIMVIAIDRYIKLEHAMLHRTRFSGLNFKLLIVIFIWILCFICSQFRHYESTYYGGRYTKGCFHRDYHPVIERFEFLITMSTSNLIAIIFYIRVVMSLQSRPQLRRHVGGYNQNFGEDNLCTKGKENSSCSASNVLGLIVILNFFFIFIPPILYSLVLNTDGNGQVEGLFSDDVNQMMSWIFLVACAVNPFIFARLNQDYQNFLKSFFCCSVTKITGSTIKVNNLEMNILKNNKREVIV